jgi:hypothetical protein
MPTGLGSAEVPSADATELPEGHDDDAVVVVGSAIVGAAVAVGVEATGVGVAPELELDVGDALPQAASVAAATASTARGIH